MKNEKSVRKTELRSLNAEEMMQIRGGVDKPVKPKSPEEVIILI